MNNHSFLGKHKNLKADDISEILQNKEKRDVTHNHQIPPPTVVGRYEEYEDLLAYFPKSKRDVEALKAFGVEALNLDEIRNEMVESKKTYEQKDLLSVRNEDWKIKLRQVRSVLDEQWTELLEKEEGLIRYMQSFYEFLIMNKEKRDRLHGIIRENKITRKRRERGIELHKHQNPQMRKILNDLREEIEKLSIYQNFLHRVMGDDPESQFTSIADLIHHYEILIERKKMLGEKFDRKTGNVTEWLCGMVELTRTVEQEIQSLKMKAYRLERKYEAAKIKSMEKQEFFMYTREKLRQKYQDHLICKESIYSIYSMMKKAQTVQELSSKSDFVHQLQYMSKVIKQIEKIESKNQFQDKIGASHYFIKQSFVKR